VLGWPFLLYNPAATLLQNSKGSRKQKQNQDQNQVYGQSQSQSQSQDQSQNQAMVHRRQQ
jgi:hypothetical protein